MMSMQMKNSFQTPGGRELFRKMYGEREGMLISQVDRYTRVAKRHKEHFPTAGQVRFFSAPGRTEIVGNHTDHNGGRVLAAAVNLDTIAAVSTNEENVIHIFSEGYPGMHIDLSDLSIQESEMGTTASLVRGIAAKLRAMNIPVAGFNATMTSSVRGGSGLSSSAAVEVLLCTIMDCLFHNGKMDPKERAQVAQYAENVYFGKPCGLMDQMASSVGGLVTIDFKGKAAKVESLSYDFAEKGYALVVVGPGGSHDDLTDAYGAIRQEMEQVAACFGDKVLRSVRPEQVEANIGMLREKVSDRAILRSLHFFDENQRVLDQVEALRKDDLKRFFELTIASGESSWKLLQNVYVQSDVVQPLALALEMARRMLQGNGAWRVHGGGFAGTILCFVPDAKLKHFVKRMNDVFGDHACTVLDIRSVGALEVTMQ